jgi:hypothetical protein
MYRARSHKHSILLERRKLNKDSDLQKDVIEWKKAVIKIGGDRPSKAMLLALNDFVKNLKGAGLYHKMVYVNCFVEGNIGIALTPLIVRNRNRTFTAQSENNILMDQNGAAGDGVAARVVTPCIPSQEMADANSIGLTLVTTDFVAPNEANDFGTEINESGFGVYLRPHFSDPPELDQGVDFWCYVEEDGPTLERLVLFSGVTFADNHYFSGNRTTDGFLNLYRASQSVPHENMAASAPGSTAGALPTTNLCLWSTDNAFFSDKRFSFAALHDGLTFGESGTFYNLIHTLRTALGGGSP